MKAAPWRALYAAVIVLSAVGCFIKAYSHNDKAYYMACAVGGNYQTALLMIRSDPHADYYSDIYRMTPAEFQYKLPFYSVKPLYLLILRASARFVPLAYAGPLISCFSYVGIAALVLIWLTRHLSNRISAICGLGLMLSFVPIEMARFSTPDALCTLVILTGLFAIIETGTLYVGLSLLIIAIWIRPDAAVIACLTAMLTLWKKSKAFLATFVSLAIASYLMVTWGGHSHLALIEDTFKQAVSPSLWIRGMASIHVSYLALSIIFLALTVHFRRKTPMGQLSVLLAVAGLIHFLIFPAVEARYFSVQYIFWTVAAVLSLPIDKRTLGQLPAPLQGEPVQ